MRLLEMRLQISQRELARELGMSVGKINRCVQHLLHRGWMRATCYKNSGNRVGYAYTLTRRGLRKKARLTTRFLSLKRREFERLRIEIRQMSKESAARAATR
jgi:EPS-associated MarR family transcriptional regulator